MSASVSSLHQLPLKTKVSGGSSLRERPTPFLSEFVDLAQHLIVHVDIALHCAEALVSDERKRWRAKSVAGLLPTETIRA
jgi:hypothetical protein